MATGTLIAESLRVGATLGDVPFLVREVERVAPTNLSDAQRAAGFPEHWTLLRFEVDDGQAQRLADACAEVLDDLGWYVDFHTEHESFVVFADRVCRYRRGDEAGRAEAEAVARERGVPDAQIDWP